jgi:hypothetical protein
MSKLWGFFLILSLNQIQQVRFENFRLESLLSSSFKLNHVRVVIMWFCWLNGSKDKREREREREKKKKKMTKKKQKTRHAGQKTT